MKRVSEGAAQRDEQTSEQRDGRELQRDIMREEGTAGTSHSPLPRRHVRPIV